MKNFRNITVVFLSALLITACDKNDTLDDAVIVGNMAPHVYWELGSSTVTAGSNVPFTVQYYTTGTEEINKLEVWYNLTEEESKTVTCPWTQTFTYNFVSTKSIEKRIAQKISEYTHNESYWNDSLHAYSFTAEFPTSNTLATTTWIKPSSFDTEKMKKYFGNDFMQHFKDSLFGLMKATDFQKMYLGLNLVDNFKVYLDSTKNENSGGWDYHFPKDAQGNTPVPQAIIDIYNTIPFADLIYNSSTTNYDVEYSRSYKVNAILKAFDKKGTIGLALSKEVSLN
ncbi:MAG: hypothetical protein WBI53_04550 [Paludibacter sp.]